MTELPKPDYARNMRIVGHTDQGGRPDGVQVMVHRGFAFVGHMFSKGFSVIDVRDPKKSARGETTSRRRQTPGTSICRLPTICCWSFTPRTCSLQPNLPTSAPITAAPRQDRRHGQAKRTRDWSAGLAVYDISKPETPRQIGFMPVEGGASTAPGTQAGAGPMCRFCSTVSPDYMFMTLDIERSREAAGGSGALVDPRLEPRGRERRHRGRPARRYGLHHAIIHGDTAYAAWRDAGMVVLDIADRSKPN